MLDKVPAMKRDSLDWEMLLGLLVVIGVLLFGLYLSFSR